MELPIRKLGHSAGLIFPVVLMRSLGLSVGSQLSAEIFEGKLLLTPQKPRYKLSELIAACDKKAEPPKDMRGWDSANESCKEVA